MATLTRSRYREVPANAAEQLVGSLGGTAVVPFYYNRLYNLNRDGSGNIIQWADAIRGYGPPAPPVLTASSPIPPTYDATKGVVFPVGSGGNAAQLNGAVSTAFAPSAGSVLGGITLQRLGAVWIVGEGDATTAGFILTLTSGDNTDQVGLGGLGNTNYQVTLNGAGVANATTVVPDGTRRLIIMTIVTGNNHGIQIPTHQALVQSSVAEPTRTTQAYALTVGSINFKGSIAEIGGLTRSPTASDLTLLQNNAVAVHGATL